MRVSVTAKKTGNTSSDSSAARAETRIRALEELKSHLRVHEFDPGDMKGLCALVFDHLSEVIEQEVKRFEDRPALDLEIEAHDRFAEDRSPHLHRARCRAEEDC